MQRSIKTLESHLPAVTRVIDELSHTHLPRSRPCAQQAYQKPPQYPFQASPSTHYGDLYSVTLLNKAHALPQIDWEEVFTAMGNESISSQNDDTHDDELAEIDDSLPLVPPHHQQQQPPHLGGRFAMPWARPIIGQYNLPGAPFYSHYQPHEGDNEQPEPVINTNTPAPPMPSNIPEVLPSERNIEEYNGLDIPSGGTDFSGLTTLPDHFESDDDFDDSGLGNITFSFERIEHLDDCNNHPSTEGLSEKVITTPHVYISEEDDGCIQIHYSAIDRNRPDYTNDLLEQQERTLEAVNNMPSAMTIEVEMRFHSTEEISETFAMLQKLCDSGKDIIFNFKKCLDSDDPTAENLMKSLDGKNVGHDSADMAVILNSWSESQPQAPQRSRP